MKLDLTSRQWSAIKLALTTRSELFEADIVATVPGPMITEMGAQRLRQVFAEESMEAIRIRDRIQRHEDGEDGACDACRYGDEGGPEKCHGDAEGD